MIYDRKTGDVQILPKKIKKRNTVIQSFDDLDKEKAALYEELGVEGGDISTHNAGADIEGTAEKMY